MSLAWDEPLEIEIKNFDKYGRYTTKLMVTRRNECVVILVC